MRNQENYCKQPRKLMLWIVKTKKNIVYNLDVPAYQTR